MPRQQACGWVPSFIEDVDPEGSRSGGRGHGGGGIASDADLAPGHVVVSAAVTVGFAISQ